MSYPQRLLDAEGEATEFERHLLEAVREEQPSAVMSEQMLANTLAAGGTSTASLAPSAFMTAGKGWALAAIAALGVAGTSFALLRQHTPTQEASPPHAAPPAAAASSAPQSKTPTARPESKGASTHKASEQPAPSLAPPSSTQLAAPPAPPSKEPTPQAGSSSPPTTPPPTGTKAQQVDAPEAASPSLREEIKLLDRVRASLTAGDADGALTRLAVYRERFPRGLLQQESLLLQERALDLAASSSGMDRP